jgi:hypothetical protein
MYSKFKTILIVYNFFSKSSCKAERVMTAKFVPPLLLFLLTVPPAIPISSLLNSPTPTFTAHPSVNPDPFIQPHQNPTISRNVYTSSKTTLSVLYTYEDVNAWVEYLETSPDQPVGYFFCRDPHNWENPAQNFAYSLGKPSGQTMRGEEHKHPLLVNQQGSKVPCVVNHLTCMCFCSCS